MRRFPSNSKYLSFRVLCRATRGGCAIPASRMDAAICLYFRPDLTAADTRLTGRMSCMAIETLSRSKAICTLPVISIVFVIFH